MGDTRPVFGRLRKEAVGERVGLGEGLGGNQWGIEIPTIVSFGHKKALSRVLGEGWMGDKVGRRWE